MEGPVSKLESYGDLSLLSLNEEESKTNVSTQPSISAVPEKQRGALQRWILSIALVNFDLELGPDVEFMYPPLGISKEEKDNIAFSAFPDTTVFSNGNLTFSWRVREVPLDESREAPPKIPDITRRQRAESFRREFRRSSAKVSRHTSLLIAGRATRSLLQRNEPEQPLEPPTTSRSTSYIYGYTFFHQKRDAALRRGYFQKSLVILTHLPYVAVFNQLATQLGSLFFEHGLPVLETFVREVIAWPEPTPGSILELPYLGQILRAALPHGNEAQNGNWAQDPMRDSKHLPILASVPQTPLLKLFRSVIPSFWAMWECMLLAEPILVVTRDPRTASEAVWHLIDLIRPIQYAGDFRPYFHIHDYDFKALATRNKPQSGTILGVTNPFFLQTCANWPHVLQLDSDVCGEDRVPHAHVRRPESASQAQFITTRKRHTSKDRVLLKEVTAQAQNPNLSQLEHSSAVMRHYFADMTERFLAPLNRYMASLIPADFSLSSPAEAPRVRPFNRAEFLASLKTHSTPLRMRQRSLSTGSVLRHSLYSNFLQCPNFSLWLQSRIAAAEEEQRQRRIAALIDGDVEKFGSTRPEIETVDLYVRLKKELCAIDRAITQPLYTGPGQRWRTTQGSDTYVAPHPTKPLSVQRERLESQLSKLYNIMPANLRAGLADKQPIPRN
ncbi:hypothetical protein MYAM1_002521 [Malassezia yamatoensis]|uniref:UDENN domain-containing protein n=1 Tax=Malassezia yamatoensis TaxID=253288 RepID=A0AAJ6CJE1_9BASI|nr:hypothetical protein MYAM1_002521 [Malassezia yamatoensis]